MPTPHKHANTSAKERKPHKHADVIKAWADGAQIQYKSPTSLVWADCRTDSPGPGWYEDTKYRVKPTPKEYKYRLYLYTDPYKGKYNRIGVANTLENEHNIQQDELFIRWISPWQTHTEEE